MNLLKPQQDSEPEEALETAMAMVVSALSDSSRVSILCALMDGRAWTATELSTVAEVSASTTSGHLARLLSNGLVVCLAQGRHRYYRLAGSHIAGLLENLMDAGSALMTLFLQKGWITRAPGYREVQVTDSGRAALSRLFNLKVRG